MDDFTDRGVRRVNVDTQKYAKRLAAFKEKTARARIGASNQPAIADSRFLALIFQ
ncbi:MAG TPA: hypothetical protein VGZ47_14725 [Gemmataceae bacterium]|nr:hypothetical protein [Gemmataceae bacterium]